MLASFGVQAKYGNYEKEVNIVIKSSLVFVIHNCQVHTTGYLSSDNLLPPVVVSEHKLSREEWEEKIAKFHAKHHGMSRAEAMMEYLKVTALTPHSVSGITAQRATAADSNAHCPFVIRKA